MEAISPEDIQAIGRILGAPRTPDFELVSAENHVYRISWASTEYFLKTFTKDWYDHGEPGETSGCVEHEAEMYSILAEVGLACPSVVHTDTTCSNPLDRPFLVLTGVAGNSLTEFLSAANSEQRDELLRVTGEYLRTMHMVTFEDPGYIMPDGPDSTTPTGWQHPMWSPEALETKMAERMDQYRQSVSSNSADRVEQFFNEHFETVADEYTPLRLVHGDCHAHQFFTKNGTITGVIDMEVSSSGCYLYDFAKLTVELAGRLDASTEWWVPLFNGYGKTPPFTGIKVVLLTYTPLDFKCHEPYEWPGTWEQIVSHLLGATTWEEIYDIR